MISKSKEKESKEIESKEGYIHKEGGKVQNWKRRYLVIEREKLTYYKKENKKVKQGEIPHSAILDVLEINDYKGKKFCFAIKTEARVYYIQAASAEERKSWMKAVINLIYEAFADDLNNKTEEGAGREKKKISEKDFKKETLIGRGGFGRVFLVTKRDTCQVFAMKILKKEGVVDQGQTEHTKTERNVLTKVNHPFLPKLYYSFQDRKNLYFVMDFINGGELFHHLRIEKKFDEKRTKFYAAQIISAISYLHGLGIIYRDLKPENCLLSCKGNIVITDFGLAKEGLHKADDTTRTRAGTPEYLAPEVIKGEKYTKAVDWWSVGTLIYEMLTGCPPFYTDTEDVQQLFRKILYEEAEPPEDCSKEGHDLINKFLERDATKRLQDPAQIRAHSWFADIDWDKLIKLELTPPFVPKVTGPADTRNIDRDFLDQTMTETVAGKEVADEFFGFTFEQPHNG